MKAVGVVGLGAMGGRAARVLVETGYDVAGYDIDEKARERAAEAGVRIAGGAAAVAEQAEVVFLSLPMPADVLSVARELAAADSLIVDLSTIDPGTAREAAGLVRRYVDAPVLGRPAGVGAWTLVAGGSAQDVAAVRDLAVGSIAKAVQHVGDVGLGSVVKLLNNLMFGAINSVTAEVLDVAGRAGLDPARFAEVVADSGAATVSPLFRDVAPRMARGDHAPVFSLALLQKDVRLGLAMATELGAPAEMTHAVAALTDAATDLGHAADDTSALIELHRSRS